MPEQMNRPHSQEPGPVRMVTFTPRDEFLKDSYHFLCPVRPFCAAHLSLYMLVPESVREFANHLTTCLP